MLFDISIPIVKEIVDHLQHDGVDVSKTVRFDGYDDAIVGLAYVHREGSFRYCLVYSYDKLIQCYLNGCPLESGDDLLVEADEYIQFNLIGAYVGPNTPIVAREWFAL